MRIQYELLLGVVLAFGFAGASFAQQQSVLSMPANADVLAGSPQVAVLTDRFHALDALPTAPVEVAPPGTVEDSDADVSTDGIATDMPRRLQSAL